MGTDFLYGPHAFAWDMLVEALDVEGHPTPDVRLEADGMRAPAIKVSWRNGAHMTMRLGPSSVHFQELCSSVGFGAPTGLYTQLVDRLLPLFKDLGIAAGTCEPATPLARTVLSKRGAWEDAGSGVWVWWLVEDPEPEQYAAVMRLAYEAQRENRLAA